MRDVGPHLPVLDAFGSSVAACIASILELDAAAVPVPEPGHPDPWAVWRAWLMRRSLALAPIREPVRFAWPGPWLALLDAPGAGGHVAVVAFGSPPGIAWDPLGAGADFATARSGWLLAPLDVALWRPRGEPRAPTGSGRVEALAVAPAAEEAMVAVPRAAVRAGYGLEGDRYHARQGTFTNVHGRGNDVTLIEIEAWEDLGAVAGPDAAIAARRNVVTRGIRLNELVGRHFTIGEVACFGQRLCEPCAHLERLTRPGLLRGLVHRGGLRADVLGDGTIHVGDEIAPRDAPGD